MTKEYQLAKLEDFLQIPAERIHDCMAELADHFCNLKSSMELMGLEPNVMGLDKMTWIDDGGKYVKTTVKFEDGGAIQFKFGDVPEDADENSGEVS